MTESTNYIILRNLPVLLATWSYILAYPCIEMLKIIWMLFDLRDVSRKQVVTSTGDYVEKVKVDVSDSLRLVTEAHRMQFSSEHCRLKDCVISTRLKARG